MPLPERVRLRVFLAIYGVVILAMTLPVLPSTWAARLVLGLPVSLVRMIAGLAVMFAAVLWLHLTGSASAKRAADRARAVPESRS